MRCDWTCIGAVHTGSDMYRADDRGANMQAGNRRQPPRIESAGKGHKSGTTDDKRHRG